VSPSNKTNATSFALLISLMTDGVCEAPVASYGMSPINAIDIFVGPTGSVDFASTREDPASRAPLVTASKANIDSMNFELRFLCFVMEGKLIESYCAQMYSKQITEQISTNSESQHGSRFTFTVERPKHSSFPC